jgi:hypothetical protein
MAEEPVERFRPTSGRVLGVLALVLAAAMIVNASLDHSGGYPFAVVSALVAFGVLVWAAMLRPGVWATRNDLVLRNMLHTVSIPLAAIETVVVRQVLAVSAGERRYVSPAVGKSWRQAMRSSRAAQVPGATESYPAFVEDRISRLAEDARARLGVARLSDEQLALAEGVRRSLAWPEIVALAVSVTVLVLALAL